MTLDPADLKTLRHLVEAHLPAGPRRNALLAKLAGRPEPRVVLFALDAFGRFAVGDPDDPRLIPPRGQIGTGLHILLLAAENPAQLVDVSTFAQPGEAVSGGALATAASRARAHLAKRCPELAAELYNVTVSRAGTARYTPSGDLKILTQTGHSAPDRAERGLSFDQQHPEPI